MFGNRKGFSLVELMIVIVIIGILAALSIPRYMRAKTKSCQSEAKQKLKEIYQAESEFCKLNGSFTENGQLSVLETQYTFMNIGVTVDQQARYTYSIIASQNKFTATAHGNIDDDATVDVWEITETGILRNITDDVMH